MGPLPYSWQNVVLVTAQAALVALPGAGLPRWAGRFAGRAWSLVLPLSIAVVVAVLAVLPDAARVLTWLALVAVPPLAAAALGWGAHGARAPLALLAVPLLGVAVAAEGERAGQMAALLLTALSCVALGRLLVGAVGGSAETVRAGRAPAGRLRRLAGALPPLALVRVALVAMAVIDAILVFSGGLETPNRALNAAVPAAELPRLQFLGLGGASMGYGDVFVAGVLGALLAAEGASRRTQALAAACTLVASLLFDLLFALDAVDVLPATVPVAVVLLAFGGWRGPRRAGTATGDGARPAPPVGARTPAD